MTVEGQLSIFDELADCTEWIACQYCGHKWKPGSEGLPTLSGHIKGSPGWTHGASENGRCANQQIALYQLGNQQFLGLIDNPPRFTTDLLGAILRAKRRGCDETQIGSVLATARPRKETEHHG